MALYKIKTKGAFFWGESKKRICDLRSFGSWCIKGTDESLSRMDSSVPLIHHDPNDLRSQIRFWIFPKKRTLNDSRMFRNKIIPWFKVPLSEASV